MSSIANRNRVLGFGLVLAAILMTSMTVEAAVKIQFDLGRGTSAITQSVGSPGLATGWFNNSDTTWNETTATTTSYSGLKYSDGTSATGVVAQYGSVGAGGTPTSSVTWNSNTDVLNTPTGNANIGIYTNNPMVDNLSFFNVGNNHPSGGAFGLQVSGLLPGQYNVFVTAVHPDALARTYNIGIGTNLTTQVASPESLTANSTSTWTDGKNYALGTVTISSNLDWLSVISSGGASSFPVINGIQIVAVPEPSSIALLGFGGLALLRRRRALRA